MKLLLFFALVCALVLGTSFLPVAGATKDTKMQLATTKFVEPVTLMGKTLQGEYLFVHDDAAMERGEACTSVYRGYAATADKLVVRFHCAPVARQMAKHFTVRTKLTAPGRIELIEFQFGGSSEGHLVPIDLETAHVDLVPHN
ncbi:MAG TPA: hypothetical protein VKB46_09300 [Pyrinomonadaceae bacterium]|nr:hypothetical protein [Pyrinomonadaceae bacterium]